MQGGNKLGASHQFAARKLHKQVSCLYTKLRMHFCAPEVCMVPARAASASKAADHLLHYARRSAP
jgi:hypothetical protein